MILQIMAAGGSVLIGVEGRTPSKESPAPLGGGDAQSFTALASREADRLGGPWAPDAVAGCEFVDDRIRHLE